MLRLNVNFEDYSVRGFWSAGLRCWQTALLAVPDTPWKLVQKAKSPSQPSCVTERRGCLNPAESTGCLSREKGGACSLLRHALNIKQGFIVLEVSEMKTSLNQSLWDRVTPELYKSHIMAGNKNCVVQLSTASCKNLASTGSLAAALHVFVCKHWDLVDESMRRVCDCVFVSQLCSV